MERRDFFKGLLAAPVMSAAAADDYQDRMKGLPPLTIKDVKVITTSGGRNYRWVFLKIITSEPGLYGIGSANDNYQTFAVVAALEKHLKPWLIGKDPDRIEDLWQSANFRTYWRGGPVNNKVIGAMDEALWDIKGKRAGMPVYEMLGGRAHDAVACYDHVSGTQQRAGGGSGREVDGERLPAHPPAVRRRRLRRRRLHSRPTRAIAPRAAIRARRSTRTCTSRPSRRSSNMCARKSDSRRSCCTTSTRT